MSFLWKKENIITKRIKQLTFHQNIQIESSEESPTLKSLRQSYHKVKKISSIFENSKIWKAEISESTVNWWISENESPVSSFNPPPPPTHEYPLRHKNFDKIKLIELMSYEMKHINTLLSMHESFRTITSKSKGYVPMILRNHNISFSGNLEEIINFHRKKIIKQLQNENSLLHFIEYLGNLIDNGEFYCYVKHVMLYNASHRWLENYKLVIDFLTLKSGLDCGNLQILDIIRLFKDWIVNIYNELIIMPRANADAIVICIETEKKLNDLLDLIADAQKIGCIKEVSKNNIEGIQKLYNVLEKKYAITEPMLILFPRYDKTYGYRSPIDLFKLGKFIRIWQEKAMLSETYKCYYDTNLFMFERCIVYTVIVNANHFFYNGHFWIKNIYFEDSLKNDELITIAILRNGKRRLILDNPEVVHALIRLKSKHKYEETHEIEITLEQHMKILEKIENKKARRWSLVSVNSSVNVGDF